MDFWAAVLELVVICAVVYWVARALKWLHWRGVLHRAKRVDREHHKRKG